MTGVDTTVSKHRPSEHGVIVLLVDDQAMIGEAVRRMLAPQEDIAFHYCQDPKQALAKAIELQPTVILQDLIMPDIDGLDLVREYRAQEETKLTPLIVLSTKEEADTKAEAFARGANDYLVKLPDPVELIARIRYHSRGYVALLERNEAYDALGTEREGAAGRTGEGGGLCTIVVAAAGAEAPIKVEWQFIPSASLGGDAFDYQWLDDDHLSFYLLDVCGHGVGPALLSISVVNLLRSRSLPDTDFMNPTEVVSALNGAFQMVQHNGMFFTIWYGVYSQSRREITYAGAGHPPALLIRTEGENAGMQELESDGLIVGVTPESDFPSSTCPVHPGDRLYLYSDGVFEIQQRSGSMWGFRDFLEFMARPSQSRTSKIEDLLTLTRTLQGSDAFGDDFSMIEQRDGSMWGFRDFLQSHGPPRPESELEDRGPPRSDAHAARKRCLR